MQKYRLSSQLLQMAYILQTLRETHHALASFLQHIKNHKRENTISSIQIFQTKCSLALATEGFSMTGEGKLECLFWAKGCCGIGVWRDLWSLYSGQSRRIGFPGCFALTLCSPCTSGKRSHLADTHTHTHIHMQSLLIESKTLLWRSRAEALKRKKSHAPSLHSFICTSLQLRRKEKEERSGHSEEVDSTTLIHSDIDRERWGEKQHLREKKRAGV